jgi:hypothetical protein
MPITFNDIEQIRKELQAHSSDIPPGDRVGDWRGQYQCDYVESVLNNSYSIFQGPCQWSGKTFAGCLYACAALLEGQRGVAAFPTLRQGGRVLIRRLSNWMKVLEGIHGVKRSRPDSTLEKTWDNGALLCALSTDESATAGIQGYTFDFLLGDEMHEVMADTIIGPLFSRLELAMESGLGRIVLMGVGGPEESAIEHCKTLTDPDGKAIFKVTHHDRASVGAQNEAAARAFVNVPNIHPPHHVDKYYDCKPVREGARVIFHGIPEHAPYLKRFQPTSVVGIDVGKTSDHTVALRLRVAPHETHAQKLSVNVVDMFTVPLHLRWSEQAEMIAEWIEPWKDNLRSPSDIMVEVNGPGEGLLQALQDKWHPRAGGVFMTDKDNNLGLKSFLIYELQQRAAAGTFGIEVEDVRTDLAKLHYSVDEMGKMKFAHSDVLSALLCGIYVVG